MGAAIELTTGEWRQIDALRKEYTWADIADRFAMNANTLRRKASERRRPRGQVITNTPWFSVKRGNATLTIQAQHYTDMMVCRGDALVVGDIHLVCTDWDLLKLVGEVGKRHLRRGLRKLIIAGDLINLDALSTHAKYVPTTPLIDELDTAAALLQEWAGIFDEMWYIMGNHEQRLAAAVNAELEGTALGRLIAGGIGGKLRISNLRQMWLYTATGLWRITHQRNYSRIKGRVGAALAAKHQSHTITHHEHGIALLMDDHARYTVVNNPALVNYEKLYYVMGADSTAPTMANGFTLMANGRPYLMTPYPSLTDWERWRLATEAQPAIAAAEARARRLTGQDVVELMEGA